MKRFFRPTASARVFVLAVSIGLSVAVALSIACLQNADTASARPLLDDEPRVRISMPLVITPSSPRPWESTQAHFKIMNTGDSQIDIDEMAVVVRPAGGANDLAGEVFDYPHTSAFTVHVGEVWDQTMYRDFPPGRYVATVRVEWKDYWYTVSGTNRLEFVVAPSSEPGRLEMAAPLGVSSSTSYLHDTVTAAFKVKNSGGQPLAIQDLAAMVSGADGAGKPDFAHAGSITLQPGQEYGYQQSQQFDTVGEYRIKPLVLINGSWVEIEGANQANLSVQNPLRVTGFTLPRTELWASERGSACLKLANKTDRSLTLQEVTVRMTLQTRDGGKDFSIPIARGFAIQPWQEYSSCGTRYLPEPGNGIAELVVVDSNGRLPALDGVSPISFTVNDPVAGTSGIELSAPSPAVGQETYAGFTIRNVGSAIIGLDEVVAAARQNGSSDSFPSVSNVLLQPGEEYSYLQGRSFSSGGDYEVEARIRVDGTWRTVSGVDAAMVTVVGDTVPPEGE